MVFGVSFDMMVTPRDIRLLTLATTSLHCVLVAYLQVQEVNIISLNPGYFGHL